MEIKWKAMIGLLIIYAAVFFEQDWLWGLFFLYWVLPSLKTGKTYLVDEIDKKEDPIVFWFIIFTWVWMSLYILIAPIYYS